MRIPQNDNFSTRCQISHRPPFRTADPLFYRCPCCRAVTVINRPAPEGFCPGHDRADTAKGDSTPIPAQMPTLSCCGQKLSPLPLCTDPDLLEEHRIEFTLFGGFEKNAANFKIGGGIHSMRGSHRIEWVFLQTFQGGQLKYLPQGGSSSCNFAFADEDAYAYCDRPICRMGREHCQFQCKRGLTLYAWCSQHGLFRKTI